MTQLDTHDLGKVAHLARLNINEKDTPMHTQSLCNILKLIEQIHAVNTEHVATMAHPLDVTQRLREDRVTEVNQRDNVQKLASATTAGLYLVPQVIE